RDLLAVDVDVSGLLPADDSSYGFDNIAGVLKLSPLLLERYLGAADEVARLAVGMPAPFVEVDYFRVPDDLSQESRLPGLPFGTRGGMAVDYTFPVDGEYTIAVELSRDLNEGVPLYAEEQLLEVAIDGERVALYSLPAVPVAPVRAGGPAAAGANNDPSRPAISQIRTTLRLGGAERAARNRIDADWQVRVPVNAGVHKVTIAFLESTHALDETPRLPFLRPYPAGVNIPETRTGAYLRSFEIAGPYDAKGPGDTPSRRAIFTCRPESLENGADEVCARQILATLARRAFRRPVTEDEIAPL